MLVPRKIMGHYYTKVLSLRATEQLLMKYIWAKDEITGLEEKRSRIH